MNDIQSIMTERVDDISLLLEQMQRMHLPALIDHHVLAHGNWQGLSLGWVTTIWLSSILSRGDHRLEAFQDITLTIIERAQQSARHVAALNPLQQQVLELLGFSSELYTRLYAVSCEAP